MSMTSMFPISTCCAAFLLLSVVSTVAQQGGQTPLSPGVWGSNRARMEITQDGATIQFECAQGTINGAIRPDANGKFTATGTYSPEKGGPVSRDNAPEQRPATYEGTIVGDTMHLRAMLADKSLDLPPFALTRGKPGRIVRCR